MGRETQPAGITVNKSLGFNEVKESSFTSILKTLMPKPEEERGIYFIVLEFIHSVFYKIYNFAFSANSFSLVHWQRSMLGKHKNPNKNTDHVWI